MRDLNAEFITRKNEKEAKPIFLYHIYEYDGSNDLFLAEYDEDIVFDSETYTRFPIKHDFISEDSQGSIGRINLKVANVNRLFQTYVEEYDLRGKKVDIIMVFADKLDDPDVCMRDTFYIDSYVCTEEQIAFELSSKLDVIDVKLPSSLYLRTHCRWKFKSTQCGYAGAETECNRTLTRCRELANQTRFGGFPSIPFRNFYVAG